MLCLTDVCSKDVTNKIFKILHLNFSFLSICSSCMIIIWHAILESCHQHLSWMNDLWICSQDHLSVHFVTSSFCPAPLHLSKVFNLLTWH